MIRIPNNNLTIILPSYNPFYKNTLNNYFSKEYLLEANLLDIIIPLSKLIKVFKTSSLLEIYSYVLYVILLIRRVAPIKLIKIPNLIKIFKKLKVRRRIGSKVTSILIYSSRVISNTFSSYSKIIKKLKYKLLSKSKNKVLVVLLREIVIKAYNLNNPKVKNREVFFFYLLGILLIPKFIFKVKKVIL
ncbi:hypothetical protein LZ32DRAFT_619736 [Colletotrichum eremochloae]|nr:hypothetical protein LZ32DRAFT_619736 [Colletotrichum eremochloae]